MGNKGEMRLGLSLALGILVRQLEQPEKCARLFLEPMELLERNGNGLTGSPARQETLNTWRFGGKDDPGKPEQIVGIELNQPFKQMGIICSTFLEEKVQFLGRAGVKRHLLLPPPYLLSSNEQVGGGNHADKIARVISDGQVMKVVGLHGLGTLHERPVGVGGDNRRSHYLAHTGFGRAAVRGDDLVPNIGGGEDAIPLLFGVQIHDQAVDAAPPHEGEGVGYTAVGVNNDDGGFHPVSNVVVHGKTPEVF